MFFRNLTLFRFSPGVAADLVRLEEALADRPLRACGPLELFSRGFVPPMSPGVPSASLAAVPSPFTLDVGHCTVFVVGNEGKLLPGAVVNDQLQRKVQKIAADEGRKVGGRERRRLREDLMTDLLARAFVHSSRMWAYVDRTAGWLVIDTASRKAAENLLTELREALSTFPAIPLAPDESPRVLMTDWLASGNLPSGLALGEECELRDPATAKGAIARCRRQDMDGEEVKEHLRNGKQVFQLALVFDGRISFVLSEDLVLRKLQFLDVVLDDLGEQQDGASAEASANFALMTLELAHLLTKLAEWFGLPRPADADADGMRGRSRVGEAS